MCLGRPQIDVCNSKVVFLHLSTHHTEACNVFPQMKYLLRDRGVEARAVSSSERRGSATLSRRRHYALWRGTARGWQAAVSAGRDAASVRSEDTLPLSVRPGKSSRAGARRERAGGRPRGEGSRGRRNGCHVARWISAPAPAPRGNKGPRGPSNPDGGCRDPARAANVRSEPAGLSPKELRPLPVWSWSFRCQEKATVFPSLLTILDY